MAAPRTPNQSQSPNYMLSNQSQSPNVGYHVKPVGTILNRNQNQYQNQARLAYTNNPSIPNYPNYSAYNQYLQQQNQRYQIANYNQSYYVQQQPQQQQQFYAGSMNRNNSYTQTAFQQQEQRYQSNYKPYQSKRRGRKQSKPSPSKIYLDNEGRKEERRQNTQFVFNELKKSKKSGLEDILVKLTIDEQSQSKNDSINFNRQKTLKTELNESRNKLSQITQKLHVVTIKFREIQKVGNKAIFEEREKLREKQQEYIDKVDEITKELETIELKRKYYQMNKTNFGNIDGNDNNDDDYDNNKDIDDNGNMNINIKRSGYETLHF